jgi:condensin complex subunit 3
MQLPDDAEVSDEIWDEVIEGMKVRVQDKIHAIRVFAVRAVSRFAIDEDDGGIIDIFLEALEKEQNAVSQINSVPQILTFDLHLIDVLFHLRRRSGR